MSEKPPIEQDIATLRRLAEYIGIEAAELDVFMNGTMNALAAIERIERELDRLTWRTKPRAPSSQGAPVRLARYHHELPFPLRLLVILGAGRHVMTYERWRVSNQERMPQDSGA